MGDPRDIRRDSLARRYRKDRKKWGAEGGFTKELCDADLVAHKAFIMSFFPMPEFQEWHTHLRTKHASDARRPEFGPPKGSPLIEKPKVTQENQAHKKPSLTGKAHPVNSQSSSTFD